MATAGAAAKPRERSTGLFLASIVTRRVALPVTALGRNTTALLLGKFSSEEIPTLEQAVNRAADAVEFAQANGLEAAMNRFNSNEQPS